jgi:hypothetical protein
MNLLMAGSIGASLAVIAAIFYNYYTRQAEKRADLAIDVVSWIDDVYDRLITIHAQREATFTGSKFGLSNDEYRQVVKESKAMLLASKMHAKVALVYGESRELDKFDNLKEEFVSIAELLLEADKDTWEEANKQINYKLSKIIEPLMNSTERSFLVSSKADAVAADIFKKNLPTLYLAAGDNNKGIVVTSGGDRPAGDLGRFVSYQAGKFLEAFFSMLRAFAILAVIGLIAWNYYGRPDINKMIAQAVNAAVSQSYPEYRTGIFAPEPPDYSLNLVQDDILKGHR